MRSRPSAATVRLILGYAAGAAILGCITLAGSDGLRSGRHRILRGASSAAEGRRLRDPVRPGAAGEQAFFGDLDLDGVVEESSLVWAWTPWIALSQFVFGILYYVLVVAKYPKLLAPSSESAQLQQSNQVTGACHSSCANLTLGFCCIAPRSAHTFHATGTLGYWPSLCLTSVCPCCMVYYAGSCTDMNERLGGERKGWCSGLLNVLCCLGCSVTQDAQSLDLATGASTGCCGSQAPAAGIGCCLVPPQVSSPMIQRQLHVQSTLMHPPPMMQSVPAYPTPSGQQQMPPDCMELLCGANRMPGGSSKTPRFV